MLYKTIILNLVEHNPQMQHLLPGGHLTLATLDRLAAELRDRHLKLTLELSQVRPGSDPGQTASVAREIVLKELEDRLSLGLAPSEDDKLSLDSAIAYIRLHTPPE